MEEEKEKVMVEVVADRLVRDGRVNTSRHTEGEKWRCAGDMWER